MRALFIPECLIQLIDTSAIHVLRHGGGIIRPQGFVEYAKPFGFRTGQVVHQERKRGVGIILHQILAFIHGPHLLPSAARRHGGAHA